MSDRMLALSKLGTGLGFSRMDELLYLRDDLQCSLFIMCYELKVFDRLRERENMNLSLEERKSKENVWKSYSMCEGKMFVTTTTLTTVILHYIHSFLSLL